MKIKKIGGLGRTTYRVAAYCRVSTDKDEQLESFETQKNYYTELIAAEPTWELVNIYADEGRSATSVAHRPQFLQMMADGRQSRDARHHPGQIHQPLCEECR